MNHSITTHYPIQDENASISIDDVIVEKPHSEENGVFAYYLDHTQNRTVKGLCQPTLELEEGKPYLARLKVLPTSWNGFQRFRDCLFRFGC